VKVVGVLLGLALLVAGCGQTRAEHASPARALALHEGVPRAHHSTRALLVVTIVNGDTDARVRGARVTIGRKSDRTDRHGVALIRVPRRTALKTTVVAPGFAARTVREPFQRRRKVTVRIYRTDLQWPMYGASPARSQAQTTIRLRPPFRVVWSRGLGSMIEFPAVVSDGVAYISNFRGTVFAVSMRSGKLVWHHATPRGEMAASPAVWRDQLIVHGMDGHVWALDRQTGRVRWHRTIGSPIESSPVIWHGVDYFGSWNGELYALDVRTHRLRWTHYLGAKTTSSAAIADGTVYIGDYGGRVWAVSARSGRTRWVRHVNGRVYGTPALSHGRVFVPSSDGGSLTAFSTGGRYLWAVHTGSYVYSSPAAWGGRVFFGSYNGVFYCVSARSGRVLWEVGLGGPISGAAVVVAGVAYAGSFADRIVGVDARSGRVLLRFPHGQYVPVSGNGGRLLLHGYSRLYAVARRR
jgi:outer membrane protein assembly factor BamB